MSEESVVIQEDERYVHENVVAAINFGGRNYPIEREAAWRIAWFLIGQCVEHERRTAPTEDAA